MNKSEEASIKVMPRSELAESSPQPPVKRIAWFRRLTLNQRLSLVISFLLVLITAVQLCLTYKAFELTEWQQRPWVGVASLLGSSGTIGMCLIPDAEYKYGRCEPKHPDVLSHISTKDKMRGYIQVRNTGNSPALSTVLKVHWCASARKPSSPPSFDECDNEQGNNEIIWKDGPRVLFHGEGDSTLDVSATFYLSQAEIDSIKRTDRLFYFIGRVDYDRQAIAETAQARYRTEFCIYYDPRGHGEQFGLYYCPVGNIAR